MQFSAEQQNDNGPTMDSFIRSRHTILFNENEAFVRAGSDRISRPRRPHNDRPSSAKLLTRIARVGKSSFSFFVKFTKVLFPTLLAGKANLRRIFRYIFR